MLSVLKGQDISENTPLKVAHTVMLLALTRPSWSAHLSKLDLRGYRNTPEGAVFHRSDLAKQSWPEKEIKGFFFPRFSENMRLCPVVSLKHYLTVTQPIRGDTSQLFISYIKPYHPVTSSTVAWWLKKPFKVQEQTLASLKHTLLELCQLAATKLS